MKLRYLIIIILLFLTSCSVTTSQYRKTYDNSKGEYSAFFKLGCISYLPIILLPWDTIDYIGPRVTVYFASGGVFDYGSSCIHVKKILNNVVPTDIKTVTPTGVTI